MPNVLDIIDKHRPFLSDHDEAEIWATLGDLVAIPSDADIADLAKRTCTCGTHIDGFDDYTDHLRTKIEESIT